MQTQLLSWICPTWGPQTTRTPSRSPSWGSWGQIGVPALLLGTTAGTSSHSTSALFANLLTVPPGPQVPIHWAVNMLPSNRVSISTKARMKLLIWPE